MNKPALISGIISALAGGAAGSTLTYFLVKKKFQQRADDEIASVKRQTALLRKDPDAIRETLGSDSPVLSAAEYEALTPAEVKTAVESFAENFNQVNNIPEPNDDEVPFQHGNLWQNQPIKLPADYVRPPEGPYVVTRDEHGEEPNFEVETLTYYEADHTLADSNDQPIDEIDAAIGLEHLQMFGMGSEDVNIVFVRNPRINMDYEVQLNVGSYFVSVLGLDPEQVDMVPAADRPSSKRAGA